MGEDLQNPTWSIEYVLFLYRILTLDNDLSTSLYSPL